MGRLVGHDRSSARPGDRTADAGSMPLAMLVVILGLGLSGAVGFSAVRQVTTTRIDTGRADAMNGAQSGLQAVAAHIRAAVDADGAGRVGLLPCDEKSGFVGVQQQGSSTAGSTRASYRVQVRYYRFDPSVTTDNPVLSCQPGLGTAQTPGYAVLTSTGTDGRTGGNSRTIRATVTLHTADQRVTGGLIRMWRMPSAVTQLCLDAGPVMATASAPVQLRVQLCDRDDPQQRFAYTTGLALMYVASKSATYPLGMCLDAGAGAVDGTPMALRPCAGTTLRRQQWRYTATRNFVGVNAAGEANDLCLNLQGGTVQPDTRVVLRHRNAGGCYVAADNSTQMFAPEAAVGAGAAEGSAAQLVNFAQYARCVDVTQDNVGTAYLTAYPCQQPAAPKTVTWNQTFTVPALTTSAGVTSGTGRIVTELGVGDHEVANRVGRYCLTATTPHVTLSPCPVTLSTPTAMQWKVVRMSTDYTSGYRMETTGGTRLCLAAGSEPADLTSGGRGKIVLQACSDSLTQKWNAPAYAADVSPLTTVREN